MPTASRVPAGAFRHFVFLVVMALGALVAFGVLLGQRFSPENYQVLPIVPDTVELAAFVAAVVAAVCGLVVVTRKRESWRRLAKGALPVAGASVLVLVKQLWNAPIQLYDMLLFCIACGWTTRFWMQGLPATDSRAGEDFTEHRLTNGLRVAVWGFVVALAVYQFRHQIWYLNNLALGYADCGENARLLFNSITNPHELFLRVNPNKPLCYDHIDFGILPFLPLWLLWPDLKLTILLQVLAVFGVAVPLFFISKRALQSELAALMIVLVWILYPSTSQFVYSASYGFRWGNMCLLLYFVALAFWSNGRPGWALVCAVWAILIKEEAAIVVGMFGVYLALFERRKLAGAVLATSAFGYFLLATSVLVPLISGHNYAMTSFFRDLGNSKLEILLSPVTKPAVFWGSLFEPASWYFAAVLLAPLLFLPLRKPSILFVGLLTFVFCCMNHILKNICFHYQAGLLPAIFWAFIIAIQQQSAAQQRFATLTGVAVSCAAVSLFLGAQPWSKTTTTIHLSPGGSGWSNDSVPKSIPAPRCSPPNVSRRSSSINATCILICLCPTRSTTPFWTCAIRGVVPRTTSCGWSGSETFSARSKPTQISISSALMTVCCCTLVRDRLLMPESLSSVTRCHQKQTARDWNWAAGSVSLDSQWTQWNPSRVSKWIRFASPAFSPCLPPPMPTLPCAASPA